MLWGIAVANTYVHGYEKAEIEISHTKLTCWIDGKDVVLNDDHGAVRSGPTAAVPGSARMRTIPCPWRSLIDPLLAKATRSGAPQQSQAFVPSSCGLEAGLTGCGTSGLHHRARRFRLVILKAARWRSPPKFHEVRYFKS